MNDKLKQRLAGAAVLLVATFVVVSMLPTPEQAAHPGDVEVVTIPLHDVVSAPAPTTADAVVPSTLAAPAPAAGERDAHIAGGIDDGEEIGSSGDDDAVAEPPPETRKSVRLALEPTLKSESAPAPTPADTGKAVAAAPAAKPEPEPKPVSPPPTPVVKPVPTTEAKAKPAAPAPSASPAPSTAAAASPSTQRWYVQIGGFADIDNARKVQANLKSVGQPDLLTPVETGKGTIYRVRAGPYASQAAAQQALDKIKALGYPGSQLVNP